MENKIVYLDIKSIDANPNNPRKAFAEDALKELSESIKELGVLQPITVRPFDGGYQVVCGERRWRAAKLAGLTEIPAIVRDLNDEEAMDIAITENLQRNDVSPFEEADAFQFLIDNKNYSIADLCKRFGKSEFFIRQRLKLSNLIPEIKKLAEEGTLSIAQVMELCKFSHEVQHDVFNDHFSTSESSWQSWQGFSAKRILELVEQHYTGIIANQKFDTTECQNCINNSANLMLFESKATARCYDRTCLKRKITQYHIHQIEKAQKRYPSANIYSYSLDSDFIKTLVEAGFDVKEHQFAWWEWTKLGAVIPKEVREDVEAGKKMIAVVINHPMDISLSYRETKGAAIPGSVDDEVQKLQNKDKRNKDIATEKTISEVRDKVSKWGFDFLSVGALTEQEKQAMLVVLMSKLERRQIEALHLADDNFYHLTMEKCVEVVNSLTEEQIAYIVRSVLINHIGGNAYMSSATKFFHEWVTTKDDKLVAEIALKHEELYLKRHERIQERIDAINNEKAE